MGNTQYVTDEATLAGCVSRGDMMDFGAGGGVIRGEAIRRLLCRSKNESDSLLRGVRLAGATIIGPIDLADLTGPGRGILTPLILHRCVLLEPLTVSGARLARVELVDCEIVYLDGRNCFVEGSVILRRVRSSEREALTGAAAREGWAGARRPINGSSVITTSQGRCEINFRGAHIDGDFEGEECFLVAPPERPGYQRRDAPGTYALNLGGARLGGDFKFSEGSAALGGISLNGAIVGGSLWLAGAKLVAVEGDAFDGQLMQVGGFVGMRAVNKANIGPLRFECHGTLNMYHASIKSALDLSGASLLATKDPETLAAYAAEIGDRLIMETSDKTEQRFESSGLIMMSNAKIGGDWSWNGSDLRSAAASPVRVATTAAASPVRAPTTDPTLVIDATGARAKADVSFDDTHAFGDIVMSNIAIEGDLKLGTRNDGLTLHTPPESRNVLSLDGISIRKALVLEAKGLLVVVSTGLDELRELTKDSKLARARSIALSWLPSWRLVEILFQTSSGPAIAAVLDGPNKSSLLYRTGEAILPFAESGLKLDSTAAAADYLRFFCAHVWNDQGGFYLLEPGTERFARLSAELRERGQPPDVNHHQEGFTATAWVEYGTQLFKAKFQIEKSGLVEMTDSDSLGRIGRFERHDFPFRRPAPENAFEGNSDDWFVEPSLPGAWTDVASETVTESVRAAVADLPDSFRERPVISLAAAVIGDLDDQDGKRWPAAARLKLENLRLSRIRSVDYSGGLRLRLRAKKDRKDRLNHLKLKWRAHPVRAFVLAAAGGTILLLLFPFLIAILLIVRLRKGRRSLLSSKRRREEPAWKARSRWFLLQYERYRPTRSEFHPQPYEMVASIYRQQGQFEDSRKITILKLDAHRKTKTPILGRPVLWLYRLTFGYGLSIPRALATFVLSLCIGWFSASWANRHGILVLNVTPDYLAEHRGGPPPPPDRGISPFLYALDVFLPLVDLHQEDRYTVSSAPLTAAIEIHGTELTTRTRGAFLRPVSAAINWLTGRLATALDPLSKNLRFWRFAKATYAFLGWIISSLTLLTITGVLRRQAEG